MTQGRTSRGGRGGGKAVRKGDLPSKPCLSCGRPFTWRKKWEAVWEEVKYCSDRCRSHKITPM
jgi:hypothetical protein